MTDHPDIVDRLETEADLCRNEGAEDIARLLDNAANSIGMERESYGQLMAENTRLRAEAEALRKALDRINEWCCYATEEDVSARLMALQQIGATARDAIAATKEQQA